ncbi:MAG: hypothetical protein BWY72_00372 [Bacteroidetes bacterium ADurb.Bin416]|nr:MAG: hypothetical protein BWY72_00372 [Bacteroidetes bacterium ADurb.Bin416]
MDPEDFESSLLLPTRYWELFTPPVVWMVNLDEVSVAAEDVASVQPVKPSSNPGLLIKLSDLRTYSFSLMLTVSPDFQALT